MNRYVKRICRVRMVLCLLCMIVAGSSAVHAASYQAKIGKKKYKTVQKAVNKVKKGQTIKLLKNVKLKKNTIIKMNRNVTFTFDMNGKTLSRKESQGKTVSGEQYNPETIRTILRISKGNVTIKNGKMKSDTGYGTGIVVMRKAKATIEGGTYQLQVGVADHGSLLIKRGTFINNRVPCLFQISGTVTIKNGTFQAKGNCLCHIGGKTTINGGKYTNTNKEYPCVYQEDGTITINKGSFFAKGSCLKMEDGKAVINGGTLEVKDAWVIDMNGKASLNISNCKLKSTVSSSTISGGGINVSDHATLNISGGTFSLKGEGFVIISYCWKGKPGKLKIDGGTFTSDSMVISTGIPTEITGGVFRSKNSKVLYSNAESIVISGGEFTAKDDCAIEDSSNYSAPMSITGGIFRNASDDCATIYTCSHLKKLKGAIIENSRGGGTIYESDYDEDEDW